MTRKEQWKKALWLYLYFAKVGCYTFGGGWSIIAQMQKDFVAKRGWITDEELLDKISVGAQRARHHDQQRDPAVRVFPGRGCRGRSSACWASSPRR